MLEKLEGNNFTKNMQDLTNEISKNNYTCGYYDEEGIHNLSNKHTKDCLKIFHGNIESLNSNGKEVSFLLHCLNFNFDIICLTETRATTIGIIENQFPDYHIFLDNPTSPKGGVAILLRKKQI